jgi:hypothetical protein
VSTDLNGRPEPKTLGELLDYIIDARGYRSLAELARHTSIPAKTLYSWHIGTRNLKRPPSPQVLAAFAADLNWPEEMVFRAAGRAYPGQPLDPGKLEVAHLWRQLEPWEQRAAERLMRDMIEGKKPPEPGGKEKPAG